jgi:hypothetical protein
MHMQIRDLELMPVKAYVDKTHDKNLDKCIELRCFGRFKVMVKVNFLQFWNILPKLGMHISIA